jgi:hypothetical protein
MGVVRHAIRAFALAKPCVVTDVPGSPASGSCVWKISRRPRGGRSGRALATLVRSPPSVSAGTSRASTRSATAAPGHARGYLDVLGRVVRSTVGRRQRVTGVGRAVRGRLRAENAIELSGTWWPGRSR